MDYENRQRLNDAILSSYYNRVGATGEGMTGGYRIGPPGSKSAIRKVKYNQKKLRELERNFKRCHRQKKEAEALKRQITQLSAPVHVKKKKLAQIKKVEVLAKKDMKKIIKAMSTIKKVKITKPRQKRTMPAITRMGLNEYRTFMAQKKIEFPRVPYKQLNVLWKEEKAARQAYTPMRKPKGWVEQMNYNEPAEMAEVMAEAMEEMTPAEVAEAMDEMTPVEIVSSIPYQERPGYQLPTSVKSDYREWVDAKRRKNPRLPQKKLQAMWRTEKNRRLNMFTPMRKPKNWVSEPDLPIGSAFDDYYGSAFDDYYGSALDDYYG